MRLTTKILSLTALAVVLGATTLACSGSSSGASSSGPVSSLDSSKTAGSLTDGEATQYCQDVSNYYKARVSEADTTKIGCGLGASAYGAFSANTDDEAKAKCSENYNACIARPATTPDAGTVKDPCADAKSQLAGCNAPLVEFYTCVADSTSALLALVNKNFCAEAKAATDGGAPTSSALFQEPASCTALKTKCPQLSDSDTKESSGG